MKRELTEDEVWNLAERELADGEDWPVVRKHEWDATESAVCLKRTRDGFILGVSCDRDDAIQFFFGDDQQAMIELTERFVVEMEKSGNPLSGSVSI